ncbi:uncharacterized protein LOC124429781 [Vespa crabro]|uniref:uncharacterized protein LOC124429781 n=1 Tax=Vespa crabro TaxID=7445 RepID=UPI001F022018|nr:uncharacterized protein LOC124429781 [Vespa crabro]
MEKSLKESTISDGSSEEKSTIALCSASGPRVLGSPNICNKKESEHPWNPSGLKFKKKFFASTLNANSLLKVGKQKELELLLDRNDIQILAIQKTRFLDKNVTEIKDYRIFNRKPAIKIMKGMSILGTAFHIHKRLLNCVTEFKSCSERMSLLTMKCKNKLYTFINCHAPINKDNKKNPNKVEEFWDDEMSKIPKSNVVILLGDFNAQIGRERIHRPIVGEYAAHQRTNRNGMRLITICKNYQMKVMSTFFRKLPRRAKTWISPNPMLGEFHIDHVAISKRNMTEIMNVKNFKSQLKGYQAPSICFKDENGKLGLSNAENCEILVKHFDQLLNCPEPKHKLEFSETTENLEEDISPNAEEIKEAINNLKHNILQLIFEDIWRTERFPEEWKVDLIHPLHKKGDKQNVDNYRGISLLQTAYKVISKILLNKIETTLDKQLGEYQVGFRKGIEISFLAFADDFAIVSDNLKSATTQINLLEEITNKAGLKISVGKAKFITNIKNAQKFLTTDIGCGKKKSAVEERLRKMEIPYGITKNFYNKRCLSKNLKIRHYATVVKPECLYASAWY